MTEGIKKIRKGLVLLIEGLFEDISEMSKIYRPEYPIMKGIIRDRIDELGKYIETAKTYCVTKEDIESLEKRYNLIKPFKLK